MTDVIFTVLLFIFNLVKLYTNFKMRMTFDSYSGAKDFLTF